MSSVSHHNSQFDLISSNVRMALDKVSVPKNLQDALIQALKSMSSLYVQNDLRPSELNSGDFIEATVRILQWLATGKHTPINRTLPPMPDWLIVMEQSSLNDSLRLNVPRIISAMYTIRSRRGVSHIAGDVSANKADAMLLLTNSRWILAEFVRIYHSLDDHEEAQKAVDLLAISETPIIESFEGVSRVITKKILPIPTQILLLLLTSDAQELTEYEFIQSIKATTPAIKQSLKRLDSRNFVHIYGDRRVKLTGLGRKNAIEMMTYLN